ncbi:tetratricopeptide repeat protein [Mesorhizobium sp. KR9-304]|uniref:tetratricopeptide repeat protein n=1 Tax=Mesorhizobium sp. KR9-304 TaxID=3156614 RepID=UPI0032B50E6F
MTNPKLDAKSATQKFGDRSTAAALEIIDLIARERFDDAARMFQESGLLSSLSDAKSGGAAARSMRISPNQILLLQALARYRSTQVGAPDRLLATAELELQSARPAKAIDALRAFLTLAPGHVGGWLKLARSLRSVGRTNDAVAALEKASALAPTIGKVHTEVGQIYLDLNETERAIRSFRTAISFDKRDFAALFSLANCQKSLGRPQDSIATFSLALEVNPTHVEALNNRGAALQVVDRDAEALRDFDAAIRLDRRHLFAWINKGVSHYKLAQLEQSLAAFETAFALNPAMSEIFHNYGLTLMKLERHQDAIPYFETATLLAPEKQQGLLSKGNALHALRRYSEAVAVFRQSIERHPSSTDAYVNMAGSLQELARHSEAIEILEESLTVRPGYSEALWNKANSMLAFGPSEAAWTAYEHRLHISVGKQLSDYGLPLLGSERPQGKRLLVQWEQRFGDVIQMLRYVDGLAPLCDTYWQVAEPLIELVEASFPGIKMCGVGECPPGTDARTPYTSLPLTMRTYSNASIPNKVPYLRPSKSAIARWKGRSELRKRRVGITWRGNPNPPGRSVPIEDIIPLLEQFGDQILSLQMDVTTDEARTLERFAVPDIGRELKTFDESAGLLTHLDLIVSIDTAVAHLSGALGIKTWILLKFGSDWRWLLERSDSPWYPSATLYRQKAVGEWQDVVARVSSDLGSLLDR